MSHFIPCAPDERREMLEAVGCQKPSDLYAQIPAEVPQYPALDLPQGRTELEVRRVMESLAAKNTVFKTAFRGAGAYRHYIPSVVKAVTSREEFVTAYTPYQAEISQGVLQSIFEFQTMICELTGMDVANASVYDGAQAAAEAVAMCRDRKRQKALISGAAHPDVIETIRTYCFAADCEAVVIPQKDGVTDMAALKEALDGESACVYLQQPNFYGLLEDVEAAAALAHEAGAKLILGVHPIAAAILKTPAACGADIAVGEGQPLGMPLSFGGPYLGFMACKTPLMRKLPGRIVGETTDSEGKRAFVLTLQAREQHIRREKASSNVCSNEALCAMKAAVYMAAMGPEGMREAARQCVSKAHYLADKLAQIGFTRVHSGEFFNEFVTGCPIDTGKAMAALEAEGILGGYPVEGGILWCATEMNTKEEIDRLCDLLKEATK